MEKIYYVSTKAPSVHIYRNLKNEAEKCDTVIRQKHEEVQRRQVQATSVGQDVEAICQICNKTKFADGVGHRCHYCQLLSCSRCGGKIHMKANRVCINFFLLQLYSYFEKSLWVLCYCICRVVYKFILCKLTKYIQYLKIFNFIYSTMINS